MFKKKCIILLVSLFFFASHTLQAAVIILRNGDKVRGKIVSQDMNHIKVDMGGAVVSIAKTRIARIERARIRRPEDGNIPLDSMWRSALLPSWGQFYQGNQLKGFLFAGGFLACSTGMLVSWLNFQQAEDEWFRQGIRTKDVHDRMAQWSNANTIFTVLTITVWVYNILDAGLFAPETLPGKRMQLSLGPDKMFQSLVLSASIRF